MLMEDDGEAFVRAVPMIKHVMMEMDHEDDDVATYTTSTSSNQLHETDIMIKLLWWFALELHLSGFIPLPPIPDGDDHQQEPIINNPKPSTSSSSSSSGDIIPFIRTDIPSNTSSLHTQLITAQDFMAFRRACLAGNIQIMTTLLTWAAGSQHLVDKMIEAQGLGCLEWALNSRWFTNKPDIFQAVFQVVWNFSSSIETKHRIQKWVAQHIDNHH